MRCDIRRIPRPMGWATSTSWTAALRHRSSPWRGRGRSPSNAPASGGLCGDVVGGGTVAVTADTLTFGPLGLTKKACEPGTMAVQRSVIGTLASPVGYTIEADVLTLDAGAIGLTFRAAP